jgi:hypothetical protein
MEPYIIISAMRLLLALIGFASMRFFKRGHPAALKQMHQYPGASASAVWQRVRLIVSTPTLCVHVLCMLTSFALSCYLLAYSVQFQSLKNVDRSFGIGFTLLSYVQALSYYVSAPFMLTVISLAFLGAFAHHQRFARITVPLWIATSLATLSLEFMEQQREASSAPTGDESDSTNLTIVWVACLLLTGMSIVFLLYKIVTNGWSTCDRAQHQRVNQTRVHPEASVHVDVVVAR